MTYGQMQENGDNGVRELMVTIKWISEKFPKSIRENKMEMVDLVYEKKYIGTSKRSMLTEGRGQAKRKSTGM